MHEVLEATRRVALEEGVIVTGSELVGLVPKAAMTRAGRYYLGKENANPGVSERELVDTAIHSMGLRDVGDFDPKTRVIEYAIGGDGPLVSMTGRDFIDTLGSSAPAPGGGSVASLCGAMSTALSAMVGSLTHGKKGYEDQFSAQCANSEKAQTLKDAFLDDIDNDTAAFNAIMAAMKLPKKTDTDKADRKMAITEATRLAINIPLGVLERTVHAIEAAEIAAQGNKNARSDAGVAALTALAAAEGAFYNVLINLDGFDDAAYAAEATQRAEAALSEVTTRTAALTAAIREQLRA